MRYYDQHEQLSYRRDKMIIHTEQASSEQRTSHLSKPMVRELRPLDYGHRYLLKYGITSETACSFQIGFYSGEGPLKKRIIVPFHSQSGDVIAYAGYSIDQKEAAFKTSPRFNVNGYLFNLHRVQALRSVEAVYLVRGFISTMKLHQAGFKNVVSLIGGSLSDKQIELISCTFTHVILLMNSDDAGIDCMFTGLIKLSHYMYVTTGCAPKKIEEMSDEEIQDAFRMHNVESGRKSTRLIRLK